MDGVLGVCAEAECLRSRREDGAGLWREETSALRRIPSGEFLDSVVSLRDEGGRVLRDAAFVDSVVSLLFSPIHVEPAAGNASYRASYRLAKRSPGPYVKGQPLLCGGGSPSFPRFPPGRPGPGEG